MWEDSYHPSESDTGEQPHTAAKNIRNLIFPMEWLQTLPPPSHLSPSALSFLDHRLHTQLALAEAPTFVAELQTQCSELDRSLDELTRLLGAGLAAYASFSGEIHGLFGDVTERLIALSSTVVPGSIRWNCFLGFIIFFIVLDFEKLFLFCWLKMEEEAKRMARVSERSLRLWRRKWLGWRRFVFMQVGCFFNFFIYFWIVQKGEHCGKNFELTVLCWSVFVWLIVMT